MHVLQAYKSSSIDRESSARLRDKGESISGGTARASSSVHSEFTTSSPPALWGQKCNPCAAVLGFHVYCTRASESRAGNAELVLVARWWSKMNWKQRPLRPLTIIIPQDLGHLTKLGGPTASAQTLLCIVVCHWFGDGFGDRLFWKDLATHQVDLSVFSISMLCCHGVQYAKWHTIQSCFAEDDQPEGLSWKIPHKCKSELYILSATKKILSSLPVAADFRSQVPRGILQNADTQAGAFNEPATTSSRQFNQVESTLDCFRFCNLLSGMIIEATLDHDRRRPILSLDVEGKNVVVYQRTGEGGAGVGVVHNSIYQYALLPGNFELRDRGSGRGTARVKSWWWYSREDKYTHFCHWNAYNGARRGGTRLDEAINRETDGKVAVMAVASQLGTTVFLPSAIRTPDCGRPPEPWLNAQISNEPDARN
ncbi:hypothetical protein B0H17DRAFT_1132619 [Mycena rosella]|uniref:Uncharacterized protein n=1 Tax=Mycena rosella TaxID=1033263 RepID=A0AAD7DLR0_MYCRO|nr:hypothetical protein B0H17DRAFT_1132619 [Mycena rosella]